MTTKQKNPLWSLARRLGVHYILDRRFDSNTWLLEEIERNSKSNPGSGGRVLRAMSKEADRAKKRIILCPINRKLKIYYKQFGFEPCARREGMAGWMVRLPK